MSQAAYVPDIPKLLRYVDSWASLMGPALTQALLSSQFYDGQQLTMEEIATLNARKQPVIRAIYDRAFRAAGLL